MHGLRSPWHSRFLGSSVAFLLIVGTLTAVAVLAQSAPPAREAQPSQTTDEQQTLANTLTQLEEMLASVDQLIVHLTATAKTHLEAADVAPTGDERARYEALYTQTSASLAELQAQRSRIAQLMAQVREKFGGGNLAK